MAINWQEKLKEIVRKIDEERIKKLLKKKRKFFLGDPFDVSGSFQKQWDK